MGEVTVWVSEGGGEARVWELAVPRMRVLRACDSCVRGRVQKPKGAKGGGEDAMATGEEGALEIWPALEPNSSSSNHLSRVVKGMNKLKLWSERFQRAPRLS